MRIHKLGITPIILLLLLLALASSAGAYTGSLSSLDGGILGTGVWDTGETTLTWDVSFDSTNEWWNYSYHLVVPDSGGEISHFLIEVSPEFQIGDIISSNWPDGIITEIEDYDEDNGNPGMPGTVHGLKFDAVTTKDLTISFSSYRTPVWGDFYSKDGNAGGEGINVVYNAGFDDADPLEPIRDGSAEYHILVPDTIVPEPATMTCLGLGLAGILTRLKIRRR